MENSNKLKIVKPCMSWSRHDPKNYSIRLFKYDKYENAPQIGTEYYIVYIQGPGLAERLGNEATYEYYICDKKTNQLIGQFIDRKSSSRFPPPKDIIENEKIQIVGNFIVERITKYLEYYGLRGSIHFHNPVIDGQCEILKKEINKLIKKYG